MPLGTKTYISQCSKATIVFGNKRHSRFFMCIICIIIYFQFGRQYCVPSGKPVLCQFLICNNIVSYVTVIRYWKYDQNKGIFIVVLFLVLFNNNYWLTSKWFSNFPKIYAENFLSQEQILFGVTEFSLAIKLPRVWVYNFIFEGHAYFDEIK